MTGEWSYQKIEDVAEKVGMGPFGSSIKVATFVSEGVPVISGEHLRESRLEDGEYNFVTVEHAEKLKSSNVFRGDIIFTHAGNIGQVAYVPDTSRYKRYVISQRQFYMRCDTTKVIPAFVTYYFKAAEGQHKLLANSSPSGVPSITQPVTYLRSITIPVPPLKDQQAVACILGALDDKIGLNRKINETLEAIARAIFKSWFVDFEPVRAKAEGRDSGLPKPLADLFPGRLEDSELGEIPAGWTVKRIEEVAMRVGMGPFGSSIKVETFVPQGIPVISGQHLIGFMLDDNTFNFVTPDHAEKLRSANVERGDVIFTHAGNIGQVSYIPPNSQYERYILSQRQFFMRCNRAQVAPSFIALYFRTPDGQHKLLANTSSSGVPSIARPVTYLRSIQLVLPPIAVMDAFEKIVQPILLQFRCNQNDSRTLAALRDTLLPKLISGELRVKDAERFIGRRV